MNPISSSEVRMAPQRRKRGTRMATPANVSVTDKAKVNGRLIALGSRNSSMKRDHMTGFVIFQTPLEMKIRAMAKAATCPTMFFQDGTSTAPLIGPAVVLASISFILEQEAGGGRARVWPRLVLRRPLAGRCENPGCVKWSVKPWLAIF